MEQFAPLLVSETVQNIKDIALVAVVFLLFLLLFVFAFFGIMLFRQVRRLASRADIALSRAETGLEKFESASDVVTGFASSLTGAFTPSGLQGLSRVVTRWFSHEEAAQAAAEAEAKTPQPATPPSEPEREVVTSGGNGRSGGHNGSN